MTGHVQGVGFRAYVVREATRLGLVGEVWNRGDGSVEVVAASVHREPLDELESRLRQGPGWVERVTGEEAEVPFAEGFVIGESR